MKYWLLLVFAPCVLFIGCNNETESTSASELVLKSIENPTPLQRACRDYIDATPDFVSSPLTEDVSKGYVRGICISLLAGEDPHQKNSAQESLLQIAGRITDSNQRVQVVEILKAAGAK